MHIITRSRIIEAENKHPNDGHSLRAWYQIMRHSTFLNFANLRDSFNSVDKVGHLYVFNIGGNNLRLIAAIHFNRQKVYIRYVLTHAEYNRNIWKKLEGLQ